jgi:hypothetical protein
MGKDMDKVEGSKRNVREEQIDEEADDKKEEN